MIFAETAPAYYAAGLPVIPLVPGQKNPIPKGWTKYGEAGVDPATQRQWIAAHPDANIGLALGKASGLCALDVDGLDVATADRVLAALEVAVPWRRVGAKGFVVLCKWRGGLKSFQVKAPDGSVLIEVLGPGRQVVLPPAIHPDTNQPYTANCTLLDVLADLPDLPEGFEAKLRAALAAEGVAMGAPPGRGRGGAVAPVQGAIAPGGRDLAGVSEAGRLAREVRAGRLTRWEAISALTVFWERFEGPDKPGIAKFVDKLDEFLRKDGIVRDKKTGKPVLVAVPGVFGAEGEPVQEELCCLPYNWDEGMSPVEKMQRGLDRVQTACGELYIARGCILLEVTGMLADERTGDVHPIGVVLRGEVGPYVSYHPVTKKKEDTITNCLALRRAYNSKIFPFEPPGFVKEGGYKWWNNWRGFAVPTVAGVADADVEPFLRLVRMMFPVILEREHLLDWIAFLFQRPGVKMKHAIMILSEAQGVGKGTLAGCICDLLHKDHRAVITVGDLLSAFNAHWLPGRVFAFLDEVQSTDRRDVSDYLKTLITSETVIINGKHVPAYEAPNTTNLMLASNRSDAVQVEQSDRRYAVYRIGDEDAARIRREFDFVAFQAWWQNPLSRGRVLGRLLARDLSKFNPHGEAPMTPAKLDLLDLTQPPWESMLQHALDTGAGVFSKGVVTVEAVVAFLAEHRHSKSPARVREWCDRVGMVPVLRRVRVPRSGAGTERVQTTVWAVRNSERWRAADRGEVLAELARSEPFEGRAERVSREAGDHRSKEREICLHKHSPPANKLFLLENLGVLGECVGKQALTKHSGSEGQALTPPSAARPADTSVN